MDGLGFKTDDIAKIDSIASDGLLGVVDSLSYRIHTIETHQHSSGSWFGLATTPTATHKADRIGPGILPFVIDAGDEDWGAWVQLFGSEDTPARTGHVFFDPHEAVITHSEKAAIYFVQFTRGASGEAGLTAGMYSELVYESNAVGAKESGITRIQTGRAPAGSLIWARCLCIGENTAELKFYLGIHEYEG